MWVGMMLNACCETHIVHPMMAATRQVQDDGAVVFSKIVLNQNCCQDLSEKMKITAQSKINVITDVRSQTEDGSHFAGSFGAVKPQSD
jgi:hypothetical protein